MAKSCMVASIVTCQNLMVILAKSCVVASLRTFQNLMITLARFWSGHHGQILHGSITSDLPEPYDNLGKILVRSLCKILGNVFSRVWKAVDLQLLHRHTQHHLLWSLKVTFLKKLSVSTERAAFLFFC